MQARRDHFRGCGPGTGGAANCRGKWVRHIADSKYICHAGFVLTGHDRITFFIQLELFVKVIGIWLNTDAHIAAYPVEYIAGIDLYNAGEFHAAHDVWEERWMGEVSAQEKLFLQAMIQSAVAFHHLEIGRPGAARQMYTRAKEKFARLGTSIFMSLDLNDYQAQLDEALSWLLTVPDPRELTQPNFQVPRIVLRSEITDYD